WCVMQFPPRPGRLSWIYATHGLSTVCAAGKSQPTRVELVMHWRDKSSAAVRIMTDVANIIRQTGRIPAPGEFLSAADGIRIDENDLMVKHVLAFAPEPMMPRTLDLPGGAVAPLMLLAISDAEREAAAKVRPELADGRLVLMNALRAGGVFPVSDPKRQCLTRRRDYLRIWEAAFRGVRTNKP
ncbi:MAG: suppressor of fused domain protein, partial [Planctomycetota bacterium]